MADQKLNVVVKVDSSDASKNINKLGKEFGNFGETAKKGLSLISFDVINQKASQFFNSFKTLTSGFVDSSAKMQAAIVGFTSVAEAKGIKVSNDFVSSLDLVKNGLLNIGDASAALKNLIATNFSLEESVKLLNAFGDAAAFNRQGSLSFGEAIRGATEGIKNQNSILVDNAGITKNLSIILKEAGYSVTDLSSVTTDAGVRQALFNGLLNEGSLFAGNAAKVLETTAGKMQQMEVATFNLSSAIGDALNPIYLKMFDILKPIIEKLQKFIEQHPELAKNIVVVVGSLSVFILIISQVGIALAAITIAFGALSAPILVVTAVIAGLVAGGALLIANWDWVKSESIKIWGAIKNFVSGAVDGIMASISKMVNVVISGINSVIRAMNKIPGIKIGELSTVDFGGAIAKAEEAAQRIKQLGSNEVSGPLKEYAKGGFVTDLFHSARRFASGGLMGDTVPAMLTPGEVVLNAAQQRNLASRLSGVTINISNNTLLDSNAAEKIGDLIVKKLSLNNAI